MRQRPLQAVLLVHAIEQSDLTGDALSLPDRADASRAALEERSLIAGNGASESSGDGASESLDRDAERFLARRAEALIATLRVRSPGVDHILTAATGAPGMSRATLLLAFVLGFAITFADGRRIDIFAYPLIGLLLWNLIVYVILIVRLSAPRDGAVRRWLTGLYGNGVRARIDQLITHSIGFNAPLAPGLRRFGADWREIGRPLFRLRAARLLHVAAIFAALGLMAGYDFRGWILRRAAGWAAGVFGPSSAHAALVTLYGAASGASGVAIPASHDLQALAWTGPTSGGGPAGPWLYLINWTALIYIVLPRLIAVVVTTVRLWHRAARFAPPPSWSGYLASVLRAAGPSG